MEPNHSSGLQSLVTAGVRESLNHEEVRRKTFINWPLSFINSNTLAMTGFYFFGHADTVRCHFCQVEIGRWEPEDNEVTEHQRWSQNCPLMKRRASNNVPINAALLENILPPISYDVAGLGTGSNIRQHIESEGTFQPVNRPQLNPQSQETVKSPKYPEYMSESSRIKSYENWPVETEQDPQQLAGAGFFYTSKEDRLKCFHCGVELRGWRADNNPWIQHVLINRTCEFMRLVKDRVFFASVMSDLKQKGNIHKVSVMRFESVTNESPEYPNHEKKIKMKRMTVSVQFVIQISTIQCFYLVHMLQLVRAFI